MHWGIYRMRSEDKHMSIQQILQNEINAIYGFNYGNKTGKVLIPAFLGDFRKVMEKEKPGSAISEEYMTEDKKMHLVFTGERRLGAHGFDIIITSCSCNGKELVVAEEPLFPYVQF